MGSTSRLSSLFSAQKKCMRTLYRVKRISKNIPGHTKATFNNNSILTTCIMLTFQQKHLNIFTLTVYLSPLGNAFDPIYLKEVIFFLYYQNYDYLYIKIISRTQTIKFGICH